MPVGERKTGGYVFTSGSRAGISPVIATVLLTALTAGAVFVFWGTISDLLSPKITSLQIEGAQVSSSTGAALVTVRNGGTVPIVIESIQYSGSAFGSIPVTQLTLKPGRSASFTGTASGLQAGETVTFMVNGRAGSSSGDPISAQISVSAGI